MHVKGIMRKNEKKKRNSESEQEEEERLRPAAHRHMTNEQG